MNNQLTNYIDLINNRLIEIVKKFTVSQILQDSILYSITAGGKRLRPLIVLSILADLEKDIPKGLDSACAIEMIHTYSLIHDDLPSMDDDDYRRGMKTNHLVFGEGIAILTGDGLLTESFNVIASDNNLTDYQKVQIISILSSRAGANGMVGGQALDLSSVNKDLNLDEVSLIHLKKTKELIEASILIGSLLAGIYPEKEEQLTELAHNLGLAFQVQDDLLDVLVTKDEIGKSPGSDEKNNKATFVKSLGIKEAKRTYYKLRTKSLNITKELFDKKLLYQLIERILHDRF